MGTAILKLPKSVDKLSPSSTPAAAPEPMQMAYVDFAMDCFRPQAEIQSNPEQLETSQSSRFPKRMVQVGVRGGIACSDSAPAAFRRFRHAKAAPEQQKRPFHSFVSFCGKVFSFTPQ